MKITEVRVKLASREGKRLKGFCSITIDNCFVIRDLRVINGPEGPFVAMPSRKLTVHCRRCTSKNAMDAEYCSKCGEPDPCKGAFGGETGREKAYFEIAHPINSTCRRLIHDCVMRAVEEETRRSSQPGYVSSYENLQQEAPYQTRTGESAGQPVHGPHPHHSTKPSHSTKTDKKTGASFGLGVFD